MLFLNKLKISSFYKDCLNNLFLIAISILILLISLNLYYFFIVLILYLCYLGKNSKTIFYISIIICFICCVYFIIIKINTKWIEINNIQGKVIEIYEEDTYKKIIIKKGIKKYLIYAYETTIINKKIKIGYSIDVVGNAKEIDSGHIEGDFDYKKYLQQNKIVCSLEATSINVIKESFSIYIIKDLFYKYINNNFTGNGRMLIKGLLLGDDSEFTDDFQNNIKTNSIMHLFAVSGLHIGLIIGILKTVLTKVKLKEKTIENIIITILIIYLIITMFASSILRSSLMYFISIINKRKKLHFTSCDVISIVFIILIVYNPYYMYNLGFTLSFLMAFSIILYSPLISKDSNIKQVLKISILALIITLPITINLNNEINLLSPIVNVIFIYLVSLIIMPITLICLILPFLDYIYNIIANAFIYLTEIFAKYMSLKINIFSISTLMFILYYILILLYLIKLPYKKYIVSIICFIMILITLTNLISLKGKIYFLDLYNGEATFITDKLGKCDCLIDTGDGTNKAVTSFLKRKGINKLDYLIITHDHRDHNGEAIDIVNNFYVSNIIVSAYDNNVYGKKQKSVKKNDSFKCGDIMFKVLAPNEKSLDENDNSIVLYTKIGNYKYLFLGDITKKQEEKILKNDIDVDVVKIGHHGSTTSTSSFLLEKTTPNIAIIMSGRTKKFDFPKQETLDILNKYKILTYNTKVDYTITVTFTKNKTIFKKQHH